VVSSDELREAMRRHAAGVCIVTAAVDGERIGLTVGSLVSVSLEPPLVAFAVGLNSSFHEQLREAGGFAVSVLAADQERLAQHFGRSGMPPLALWAGVETREGDGPEPLLAGAVAWLRCRTRAEYPAGDHTIFVAEVLSTELGRDERALVYLRGAYSPA
jgi:flavin reductase (DIM6/NTAB) family NADH-FMN oxidoreductase RutF